MHIPSLKKNFLRLPHQEILLLAVVFTNVPLEIIYVFPAVIYIFVNEKYNGIGF